MCYSISILVYDIRMPSDGSGQRLRDEVSDVRNLVCMSVLVYGRLYGT